MGIIKSSLTLLSTPIRCLGERKFWDFENDDYFIGILGNKDDRENTYYCDLCDMRLDNCRPVRRDEVTFYEDRKDE